MSERRKNTDRRETFQLATVTTNRSAGGEKKKNDSYPAVRNYSDSSEWQYQRGFFNLDFSWQRREHKSGQNDVERFRIKTKMRKAGETTHGPFLTGTASQDVMPSFTFPLAVQVRQAAPEMNYLQNGTRHRRQVSRQFVAMSRWPQPNPLHHPHHPLTSVCCNAIAEERNVCRSLELLELEAQFSSSSSLSSSGIGVILLLNTSWPFFFKWIPR